MDLENSNAIKGKKLPNTSKNGKNSSKAPPEMMAREITTAAFANTNHANVFPRLL